MSRRLLSGAAIVLAWMLIAGATARAQAGGECGPRHGIPEAEMDAPQPGGPGMACLGHRPMMRPPGPGGPAPDMPPRGMPGMGAGMWGPDVPPMDPDGLGPPRLAGLELTDAQRARLAELRDQEQRKCIRLDADLRIARLDLRRLAAEERPNLQAIGALVDRMADLRAGIAKARITTRLGMLAVLEPGQRAALRAAHPGPPGGR